MTEIRGMLACLMRVVDTLATNQKRQVQGSQVGGSGGDLLVAPTAPIVQANTRSQLLKDFIAFRPPAFHGGTDAIVAENWMLLGDCMPEV